ncbi:MAG: flagellar biosynthetic protein FliO [Pseudomonadales bacterium]
MIPRITVLFVGLLAAVFVSASDALNKPTIEPVFSGTSIVQVVLSLAFVIVLIYAAAWYIRRMQLTTAGAGQSMRVISALSIGSRERLVLVQIGEEQLLLGVAPGRVNLLHQFDSAIINSQDSGLRSSFSKILGDASSKSSGESAVS